VLLSLSRNYLRFGCQNTSIYEQLLKGSLDENVADSVHPVEVTIDGMKDVHGFILVNGSLLIFGQGLPKSF